MNTLIDEIGSCDLVWITFGVGNLSVIDREMYGCEKKQDRPQIYPGDSHQDHECEEMDSGMQQQTTEAFLLAKEPCRLERIVA